MLIHAVEMILPKYSSSDFSLCFGYSLAWQDPAGKKYHNISHSSVVNRKALYFCYPRITQSRAQAPWQKFLYTDKLIAMLLTEDSFIIKIGSKKRF